MVYCTLASLLIVGCKVEEIIAPELLTISESFKNPIGFYNNTPTFSWRLPISQHIKSQSAYQIVVASSKDLLPNNADLWDSGKQLSAQSTFVKYEGKPLKSRQKVFWQVRFWNQEDKNSGWSDVNTFELGLLNNSDWKANWIGLDTAKDSIKGVRAFLMHRPQYLRKRFELFKDVASARLYITAKGVFDVHLNGKDVSDDVMTPGWTPYNHRIETLTYNITEFLKAGKNAIGVELASGWHSGRISRGRALYENFASPKILCQLEIVMKNGSKQTIISDKSWKGTTNGPLRLAGIYDGEVYDANFEMPNWNTVTFDDSNWKMVEVEAVSKDVKLAPKRHQTVKNQMVLKDVEIVSVKENTSVFNLKQNIVGVPKVSVPMKKGDTLKIRFSEMLLKDNTFYTKNYRSAKSTDYYVASKDGVIEYVPKFTFHGFQFLELSGYDKNAKPEAFWVQGIAQHSNFEKIGTFTSSHHKLNQLQSNITWGLRDNFFDVPTDCPQRDERLGWTGDAQVIAPTALFNYDTHAFWAAWLQSMRETQSEHNNGLIPFIIPDVLQNNNASSGWGDASVIIPWDVYNITGDISVLQENYEMSKKWVGYYQSKAKNYIPSMYSFADWLQPYPAKTGKTGNRGDTPKELINTAYFAHSAHLLSKIASILGKTEDEKKYKDLYNAVSNAFENTFFDAGKFIGKKQTQTAYLLAIHFNLLKQETKEKAKKYLLEEIKNADYHLGTGFLGTPILPKVLDDMGEIDLMYKILFKETYPSWFYSINQGATTMWERWNSYSKNDGFNPQSMNSLNHYAYGAVGQWMYERLAGLASLEPGYKKIRIAPVPNTEFLTSASASVKTPYGVSSSSWKIENDTFTLDVVIPPNTSAEVHIPYGNKERLFVNGSMFAKNSNLKLMSSDTSLIKILAEPGTYNFQTKL
ncbi:Bacterial alpha-L-rhamnosidase [Algibacter amylolyticus]|uniref:alpha-L-rhamnosidase n=2 Tax=Algibacter amylolyticus TaxID=1608400 RepID=A0A5M7B9A0_9FLAO|nr:glycoside hydrolase family 78 protein [Algibacter amylolyticus]KAA5824868.1 Bacterial alpha-L-rhamnosidase [Algibacter amylolyticus]MBB5268949.1 alpha-L-rhamnosidase [Algibacter amylolyticus]TSJ76033.1 Bacterial alpha-L-rhamnosidase [Algibacter amylolyticus]